MEELKGKIKKHFKWSKKYYNPNGINDSFVLTKSYT